MPLPHATRRSAARLLLVSVSVAASVLMAEAGFRVYGAMHNIDFRLYARELKNSDRLPREVMNGREPVPNGKAVATTSDFSVLYSINSRGFRDREYTVEKPKNVTRISMYGDSFTYGEGVPYGQRFADIVESSIPGTEVLDMGVPGYGLDQIAARIVRGGFAYSPDYVVIVLNRYVVRRGDPDLDISEILDATATGSAALSAQYVNSPGTVYLKRDDPFFSYRPNVVLRHSYLLSYLHYKLSVFMLRGSFASFDRDFWGKYKSCASRNDCDRLNDVDLKQRTITLLTKIDGLCREQGSRLIAVNIDTVPLEYFFDGAPPFPYIDLHEDVAAWAKTHQLSFTYDYHYNPATHALLGRLITERLKPLLAE